MEKGKTSQKGAGKQRPGTEQAQSGTNLQKGQTENIQAPKQGQQKHQQQQERSKSSKKGER
jgi:hypothetical protein